ncbi:phosphotransferase family protein [Cellulomonas sp. 179-A 9B4 NHS]|uniref:phosphotransferase family protein n=1 Tax=Cellulomonas sp. 179-A 9B4 NHS TaxID=3142379 RepID=UPI00399F76F1
MAVPAAVVAAALDALRPAVAGLVADDWAPSVQGAVGHVVGVRDGTGRRLVLKLYRADAAGAAASERVALELVAAARADPGGASGAGLPVPAVVAHGRAGDADHLLMTRLDGVRWADRRDARPAATSEAVWRAVGAALRRVHAVRGDRYGGLVAGPWHDDPWAHLRERAGATLDEYLRTGGDHDVARDVDAFVVGARDAVAACPGPVLCHRDLTGGNLLVDAHDRPSGVVDWERAAWDDPLADLAQTVRHVRTHRHDDVRALLDGYGDAGPSAADRLAVHEVVHAVRERAWVVHDRPAGWQRSAASLDAFVAAVVRA